jgi:DHA3 family tetracycline resistance protein-like MFS transporter
LFGALDDLGLTLGPALAAVVLVVMPAGPLLALNAASFAVSALLISGIAVGGKAVAGADGRGRRVVRRPSLFAEARAGVRELAGRPEVRALLWSSTAAVVCIGMTNVGEVVLAREVLGAGASGLALLMAAAGLGTVAGSLAARFSSTWEWRRAYIAGLGFMAAELLACAVLPSLWMLLPVFALGGFGNGFALVHDRLLLSHAAPESMHGRLFALQKTCTSLAFAASFLGAGIVIAGAGVQTAFLFAGLGLLAVMAATLPRLRAAWPAPPATPAPAAA